MSVRALKYFSPLIFYIGAWRSFTSYGIECFIPLIYAWFIIPVLELFLEPDNNNLREIEEEVARKNIFYDIILYTIVFLQFPSLILFLHSMEDFTLTWVEKAGRIGTMGLLCGTFGINVGHELGHRVKPFEKWFARFSLMTSLYMHFHIEHNKGHHKHVATPQDPSSARLGEMVYAFWPRTIIHSYISAWRIANDELIKRGRTQWTIHNEMIQAHIIQGTFLGIIVFVFGIKITLYYIIAASIGILLLETVNYIEHYGLTRKEIAPGRFERAMPHHSWNSNHVIGRLMLFELSRHSDHHYLASRKYQVLRNHFEAPQMPTGYPGMMILSLFPPAWFLVMNARIKKLKQ